VSTKYYWSKVFSTKTGSIHGLKFSTDGKLLIAHTGFTSLTSIIVVDVVTGRVLSARNYSSNGNINYSNQIKSLLISSGNQNSHQAYVLSNLNSVFFGSSICPGQ
jgi:hypothetical protein